MVGVIGIIFATPTVFIDIFVYPCINDIKSFLLQIIKIPGKYE
jgi:hypothetical protein